jgi:hypothetical protein
MESPVRHERGHTYGLGDLSESSHRNLTVSERSNGAVPGLGAEPGTRRRDEFGTQVQGLPIAPTFREDTVER